MRKIMILIVLLSMLLAGCIRTPENSATKYVLTKEKTVYYETNSVCEKYYRTDGQIERIVEHDIDDFENLRTVIICYDDRGFICSLEAVGECVIDFYSSFEDDYYICTPIDDEYANVITCKYRKSGELYSSEVYYSKEHKVKCLYDKNGNVIDEHIIYSQMFEQHSNYTYERNLLKKVEYSYNGQNHNEHSITEYKYDENGFVSEAKTVKETGETVFAEIEKLDERTYKIKKPDGSFNMYNLDSSSNIIKIATYVEGQPNKIVNKEWAEIN